ncbi:hypothetical protein LSCM1_06486 [Leishmania martiniquensis]|uniref:Myotubularin phosphatase domain-containing protein n=1 Tax=Leishmania martiniquensis TaxID=1580590 RepID=A0A836H5T7_9TRYP|nr:hypothetical protein LSCM1_06486 [Leishmania martiniquensis]
MTCTGMSFPPFRTLEGEVLDLNVSSAIDAKDAVALLYFCGGDEKACVVQPCSLALSQYQMHIGPLGREACVEVPYMFIATWGIARASSSVTKAFVQVQQQAEETARTSSGAASMSPAIGGGVASTASPSATAAVAIMTPLLSAPPAQVPQPAPLPSRPRYADPLPALYVVTLQTKHVWQHRLIVQSERLLKNIRAHLTVVHCLARVSDLPAFRYAEERQRRGGRVENAGEAAEAATMWSTEFGWNLYSPQREFTRQLCVDASRPTLEVATEAALQEGRIGLRQDLRPWFSLVDLRDEDRDVGRGERPVDCQYTCSPTYPWLFLQPKLVDRELLLKAMAARSRARVPAVSYVCLRTGAVLARSSQPLMRSPQLSADSDVCYTLINMGYGPHRTHPQRATSSAAAALPPVTSSLATAQATAHVGSPAAATSLKASPVVSATAAATRPVRPPSLFDDDSDGDGRPTRATSTSNASSAKQLESAPANGNRQTSLTTPSSAPPKATRNSLGTSSAGDVGNVGASQPAEASQTTTPSTNASAAKVLLVVDCRPQITAAGNAQLGGGYESGSHYTFCQTNFFEIDNIFGVAKSFEKLRSVLARYQGNTVEKTFLRRLYDSDWLAIVQRVLVCSVTAAQSLQSGVSCLVHCTDGWDRTSQCTALAMLLLDPYYRTIVGFCTLIEKEFCSFGHKFAERSGHQLPGRTTVFTHSGVTSSDTEQQHGGSGGSAPRLDTSPIFVHFLDAVFQVCRQYPTCFEFTPELLAHLSEVVYSCLYGTFLCNGEQERRLEGVRLRTASVWTDILRRVQREKAGEVPLCFVNVDYDAATAWRFISQRRRGGGGGGAAVLGDFVLRPNCSSKRLVFWEQLYTREDADHYLSYNPNVHAVKTTRRVSWGAEFDRFLDAEVEEACAERVSEMASLAALEAFMTAEANTTAAPLPASNTGKSAWCVFDAVNCFNCYKPFGMWSTKAQCAACKQYFCADCHVHDCILQQY